MLNPRILVLLADLPDAEAALDMALAAIAHARRPNSLRFAVPLAFAGAFAQAGLPAGALGAGDVKYAGGSAGVADLLPLVTDETHFLCLRGPHAFADRWEQTLLARFAKAPGKRRIMTAALLAAEGGPQAYLPAIHCFTDDRTATVGAGLPLVCAAAPVKTLLVHPAFVFGGVDFVRNVDAADEVLSIAAYAAGYAVYALDSAPLWPLTQGGCAHVLAQPGPESLPPPMLARFEQLAGISFARRSGIVRAMEGLFGVDDGYPQRLPLPLLAQKQLDHLPWHSTPRAPLAVAAYIDLPDAPRPPQAYMLRLHALMRLHALPLTLYAGGEMERHLRAVFANTLAYPDNALLPRALLLQGMTPAELFRRNKLLLLQRAQRAYPAQSHVMWLDADTLPHPVCPDAPLSFAHMLDERVHIAWVNGEPDTSMIVVPVRLLAPLVREVQAHNQFDIDGRRDLSERALMRHLLGKYPELFTLHPLPAVFCTSQRM